VSSSCDRPIHAGAGFRRTSLALTRLSLITSLLRGDWPRRAPVRGSSRSSPSTIPLTSSPTHSTTYLPLHHSTRLHQSIRFRRALFYFFNTSPVDICLHYSVTPKGLLVQSSTSPVRRSLAHLSWRRQHQHQSVLKLPSASGSPFRELARSSSFLLPTLSLKSSQAR
jgi:hypothetical protein